MAIPLLGAITSGICGAGIGYIFAQKRQRNRSTNGVVIQDHDREEEDLDHPSELPDLPELPQQVKRQISPSWNELSLRRTRSRSLETSGNPPRKIYGLGGYSHHNKVMLCMVGLPARGKSYIVKMLTRYLQWQGFPVKAFNAGNTRREKGMAGASADFFGSDEKAKAMREQLATECMEETIAWLNSQISACVAIFDATNTTKRRRLAIVEKCANEDGVTPVFIESICNDPEILQQNYGMKLQNDDYKDMDPEKARADFLERVKAYETRYETVEDDECDGTIRYVKLFNVGQKVVMHHCSGYVVSNVGFYLSNIHIKPRRIWLMRHAETEEQKIGKLGSVSGKLTHRGTRYCREVAKIVHECSTEMKTGAEVLILTGTAPVHAASAEALLRHSREDGDFGRQAAETMRRFPLMSSSLLNELDGGDLNGMSYEQIKTEFPEIWNEREHDKLNFRYPGAGGESYTDVIHRLGPVIIELERMSQSCLIISHLAVQRCIFAYFASTPMEEIPHLDMAIHTLYELCPSPHGTQVKKTNLRTSDSD